MGRTYGLQLPADLAHAYWLSPSFALCFTRFGARADQHSDRNESVRSGLTKRHLPQWRSDSPKAAPVIPRLGPFPVKRSYRTRRGRSADRRSRARCVHIHPRAGSPTGIDLATYWLDARRPERTRRPRRTRHRPSRRARLISRVPGIPNSMIMCGDSNQ